MTIKYPETLQLRLNVIAYSAPIQNKVTNGNDKKEKKGFNECSVTESTESSHYATKQSV